jgi:uncharacterized protein (TIRG00374 family)
MPSAEAAPGADIPGRHAMATIHRSSRGAWLYAAKLAIAVAILAYLVHGAQQEKLFSQLVNQQKNWMLLGLGFVCAFLSVGLSFIRWRLLVVAQGITFRTVDALRLGSLGYVLNFVSPGSLGGDLFKAVFLARDQPGRRTEAVATVVVDRLMGLAVMLVLASTGILVTGMLSSGNDALRTLCYMILAATAAGLVAVGLLLFVPGLTGPRITEWAKSLPLMGTTIARLLGTAGAYRKQKPLLLRAVALSFLVDLLYIASFYLVAHGLPFAAPSLEQHLLIVPVATLAGAIPATPGGLGTLEAAVEALYRTMPGVKDDVGTIVTLAHRLTTVAVGIVGLIYYLGHRAEVRRTLAEAEELAESG